MSPFNHNQQVDIPTLKISGLPSIERTAPVESFVRSGNVSLLSVDYPGQESSPLLLIHGVGHTHHTFDNLSPFLTPHFKTVAYDIRGHGQSGHNVDSQYKHRQFVDDMTTIVASRDSHPTTVVASSISALHALQFAAENPKSVSALVMIDILPVVSEKVINGLRKFFQLSEFDSFEELVDKYGWISPTCSKENISSELKHSAVETSDGKWTFNFDRAIIDIVGAQFMKEFQEHVPFVRCPVLLITGGISHVVPPGAIAQFRETLPSETIFEHRVIPNAAHCPWREDPKAVFESVLQFTAELR